MSVPSGDEPDQSSPRWVWEALVAEGFVGGNVVQLLQGGNELFPAMHRAIAEARSSVWLATYIFHLDEAGQAMAEALQSAAARGVRVQLVVDGFGSKAMLPQLRQRFAVDGVELEVYRPLDRWAAWLQPGQLRRLHHKLCVVDDAAAFVGGINIIDDRIDLRHGRSSAPRLDFAVELRGPVVQPVQRLAHAIFMRARLGHEWRSELRQLARSERPVASTLAAAARAAHDRSEPVPADEVAVLPPVNVAFVVRDNLRQRRAIERSYIGAIRGARERVDIACAYFYPGRAFRRSLLARGAARCARAAAAAGQGRLPLAALAARVLYDELLAKGVRIYEYTPAFLHAKVAVVDDHWATVGSSNIDPLSLLLNLEANVVVRDADFARGLRERIDLAAAASLGVTAPPLNEGWRRWLSRGVVAWCAGLYLRLAGITGRY